MSEYTAARPTPSNSAASRGVKSKGSICGLIIQFLNLPRRFSTTQIQLTPGNWCLCKNFRIDLEKKVNVRSDSLQTITI